MEATLPPVLVCRPSGSAGRPYRRGATRRLCAYCKVPLELRLERAPLLAKHPGAQTVCIGCLALVEGAELLGLEGRTIDLDELAARARTEVAVPIARKTSLSGGVGRDTRFEEGRTVGAKEDAPCSSCGRSMIPDKSGLCRSCRKTQGRCSSGASGGATSRDKPGEEESCRGLPVVHPQTTPTAAPTPAPSIVEPEHEKEEPMAEAVETQPRFAKVEDELEELEKAVSKKTRPCGCAPFGKHRKGCSEAPAAKPARVRIKAPEPGEGLEKSEPEKEAFDTPLHKDALEVLLALAELDQVVRSQVIEIAFERWSS